jgi:16S rRNA (cytosine1402-N4)-methyltransferase
MNQSSALSAYEVINEYDEAQLKNIFYAYADLKNAPKLAGLIVDARKQEPIENSERLNDLLKPHLFKGKENKVLAQIYQAIRIEVNQEIEALKYFLKQTEELVVKNGRISLISYHSLEDRLVKRYIRNGLFEGEAEKDFYGNISVPFKKTGRLIVPSAEEIKENNRARSAKLRVAKKL